jgi:hypothetical protein
MGAGVEAVKQELASEFGAAEIRERQDFDKDSTVLGLEVDGVKYSVRVSREFDNDYPETTEDLADLEKKLEASKTKKVAVRTDGILED